VDGMAHTNGIESFRSMLKRGHHDVYHKMSSVHLGRYVNDSPADTTCGARIRRCRSLRRPWVWWGVGSCTVT